MADYDSQIAQGRGSVKDRTGDMSLDVGLRNFMLGVYAKLALGLLLTGAIAWTVANVPAVRDYFFIVDADGNLRGITLLGQAVRWAPIVILLGSMFIRSMTVQASGFLYWSIVSLIGLSGALWFLAYRLGDIGTIFFITASAFGALSLWGYTTKRDLSGWGVFLMMAGWGVFLTLMLNAFFLHNEGFRIVVALIGVLIFAGFTAYDTQMIKGVYYQLGGSETKRSIATNVGALNFYLDFINMFQLLLSVFGGRR
jgi:uncharacterized protein